MCVGISVFEFIRVKIQREQSLLWFQPHICVYFLIYIFVNRISLGFRLSVRQFEIFWILWHFIDKMSTKTHNWREKSREMCLLTASLDQRSHPGQSPHPPLYPHPPLQWLTGGLVVLLVLGWGGGRRGGCRVWRDTLFTIHRPRPGGSCEKWRCWGGLKGGGLSMWSAGIYIWSLDIDQGSASACCHSESLETLREKSAFVWNSEDRTWTKQTKLFVTWKED